jgi:signal transduction histidine kinase
MRSITQKLVLAFVGISLLSILLVVLVARYTTDREFRDFTFTNNNSSILIALQDYYNAQGSWQGIEHAELARRIPPPNLQLPRRDPLTVTDVGGKVLRPGSGYFIGDIVPADKLQHGTAIEVNGKTVGYLIFAPLPFEENSPERAFLNRINQFLIYSAIGTIAIALFLGILLSRTLTRPIRELTAATRAVSEGNLSLEVPVRSRDEMGELAGSFNRMSAELARSLNLRRQMTADIAHELRTPLSLILGHAEAVHDGVLPPTVENFEIIREEALRLERLVDDLRTLSLADAGELSLDREPVALQKLIQTIATRYRHLANQRDITLTLNLASSLPEIPLDAGRIIQVLTNILDNALRHTPNDGKIIISAKTVEGNVEVSIQDSGPGAPESDLPHLFDRFYRADSARDRASGGSGLGLAIARSIIEAHQGNIWAENGTNGGLRIVIMLPTA